MTERESSVVKTSAPEALQSIPEYESPEEGSHTTIADLAVQETPEQARDRQEVLQDDGWRNVWR